MFNIREYSSKIQNLLEIYEKEEQKLKKIQILNEILKEIKFLETHLEQNYGTVHITEKNKLVKELKIIEHKQKLEQNKEYQISTYGKISNLFFSKLTEFFIETFSGLNKKTTLLLRGSGLRMLTNTYISITLFSAFLFLFIGVAIGIVIFYQTSHIQGILLGLILSFITFLTFIIYPSMRFHFRRRELNEEYAFLVNYLSALSNSRIKNISLFETFLNHFHQKILTPELKKIILYNKVFNYPLHESILLGTQDLPSEKTRKFFQELAEVYKNQLDPSAFLNKKAHESLIAYESLNRSPFKILKNLFYETSDTLKQIKFDLIKIVSIIVGLGTILLTYLYISIDSFLFPFLLFISFLIIWTPIFLKVYKLWNLNKDKESQFLTFAKDLNKTKNPLDLTKNYFSLDASVKKFISQYKLGIPLEKALDTFGKETNNTLIESSISLAVESKKHNADIYEALENITKSKVIRNILRTEKI